jgi:hypothetical protein
VRNFVSYYTATKAYNPLPSAPTQMQLLLEFRRCCPAKGVKSEVKEAIYFSSLDGDRLKRVIVSGVYVYLSRLIRITQLCDCGDALCGKFLYFACQQSVLEQMRQYF